MEENLSNLLELIAEEQVKLTGLPIGSDEYLKATESIERLWKVALAHMKNEIDISQIDINENLEMMKIKNDSEARKGEKKHEIMHYILDWGKVIIPAGGYIALFLIGLSYEKEGAFTMTTVRNLLSKQKLEK